MFNSFYNSNCIRSFNADRILPRQPNPHQVNRQVLEQYQIQQLQQDIAAKEGNGVYKRASSEVIADFAGQDERHGKDARAGKTIEKAGLFTDKRIQISHVLYLFYCSILRLVDGYLQQSYYGGLGICENSRR